MRTWIVLLSLVSELATASPAVVPNLDLTPGVSHTDLTKQEICNTHWGLDKRHVTASMKRDVEQAYHFKQSDCPSRRVEIDHLISRELGGADDVKNLWPQCYEKQLVNTLAR